jgi:hypothetical protein
MRVKIRKDVMVLINFIETDIILRIIAILQSALL